MQNPLQAGRLRFTILPLLLLSMMAAPAFSQSDKQNRKQQREKLLKAMRSRAERIKAVSQAESRPAAVEMIPDPLFRYDDQPRQILDGTLWGWGKNGRPLALCKIEWNRGMEGSFFWTYCMTSLSTGALEIEVDDDHRWRLKKPGLDFKPLDVDIEPSASSAARLRQFKGIATEFSAKMRAGNEQLRLLPRPVHRYADKENGISDGAIFSYSSFGTNPTVLLILEIKSTGDDPPTWQYAFTAVTNGAVSASRDEEVVWSARFTPQLGRNSENTWTWFFVDAKKTDNTEEKGD